MTIQQPAFTAFAVSKRGEGQDDWWNPIGAAFPHQDGKGYNSVLQAMPLNGKIVLRPPKEEADETPANPNRRETRRNR